MAKKAIELVTNMQASDAFQILTGGGEKNEQIKMLNITSLYDYSDQTTFRPYTEEKLKSLAASISIVGVQSPLVVRPHKDGWQILAGHNRRAAAAMAGKTEVPCVVRDVDDDTADIIFCSTNLDQRDELTFSEKAKAYKKQMDAIKRQGERKDLTSRQPVGKLEAADIIGELSGESGRTIQRYIRLTYLTQQLLDMVDANQISFGAGIKLSYHHQDLQKELLDFMEAHNVKKITVAQANEISLLSEMDEHKLADIFALNAISKKPKTEKMVGKSTVTVIENHFKNHPTSDKELAKIIEQALKLYFEKNPIK